MNCESPTAKELTFRVAVATSALVLNLFLIEITFAGNILISGNYFASGGTAPAAVFRFDREGDPKSMLGNTPFASFGTVATYGSEIYVGLTIADNGQQIRRFSKHGEFLGFYGPANLGLAGAWKMEFDSSGNLYVVDVYSGTPVRIDSNGVALTHFPRPFRTNYPQGIDADTSGNVYVGFRDVLSKYDPAGNLLSSIRTPEMNNGGDIAIDESSGTLYRADENDPEYGIKAYDISGSTPVFLSSIPTPGNVEGLSFDARTGHLLASQVGIGTLPGGLEMLTDGTILREYPIGGTAYVFDIVAIQNPEPTSLVLLSLGCTFTCLHRPRRKRHVTYAA